MDEQTDTITWGVRIQHDGMGPPSWEWQITPSGRGRIIRGHAFFRWGARRAARRAIRREVAMPGGERWTVTIRREDGGSPCTTP